jgi:diguanylate cyclase (GGDEF)-like protein/PAS domain S-box-containing protein
VLIRERPSSLKTSFLLTSLAVGAWLLALTLMNASWRPRAAHWWAKAVYLAVPFICTAFGQLTAVLLAVETRYRKHLWTAWTVSVFVAGLSVGTDWLIQGVQQYWWGFYPQFGWLLVPLLLLIFGVVVASLWEFQRALRLREPWPNPRRLHHVAAASALTLLALFDCVATWAFQLYPVGYLVITGFLVWMAVLLLGHAFEGASARSQAMSPSDAMVIFDRKGIIKLANQATAELFGWKNGELVGQSAVAVSQGLLTNELLDKLFTAEGDGATGSDVRREYLGNVELSASVIRNGTGDPVAVACIMRNLQEAGRPSAGMAHQALYDGLTKLPNRMLFMDYLKRALGRAKRHPDYCFAVLFLDLDRFKIVNDSLGLTEGDQLLHEIARRLERCLRPGDAVARLGGDEFAMLLDDIKGVGDATRIAERIHKEVTAPFLLAGQEVFTTASIGIAISGSRYEYPDQILKDADTAMYRAKGSGKACHAVFDTGMHAYALNQLKLEGDLRRAVENEEFRVYYQPIVSLRGGRVTGFEALIRWQHPTRGLIAPAEFIPAAEETGLIIPIGQWILRQACRQLYAWNDRFHITPALSVSVNLSSKQFLQPDLIDEIRKALKDSRLEPQQLRLEITESVIMEKPEATSATVLQLKTMGVQLYIDDFGTGYSSLSYLHKFAVDALKIDRSFSSRLHLSRKNLEIVRTIIALAQNLGMQAIAEGVESGEQLAQLRALKCPFGQGHLTAPLRRDS